MSDALRGKRLLIVDDDPVFSDIAETLLLKAGAAVTTASNGADALHYFESNTCDLAIIDLIMPKVDGLRLISILRHMPKGKHLPIVVVTSRRDAKARLDAERFNVDLFFNKPIQWTSFTTALGNIIDQSRSDVSPVHAA